MKRVLTIVFLWVVGVVALAYVSLVAWWRFGRRAVPSPLAWYRQLRDEYRRKFPARKVSPSQWEPRPADAAQSLDLIAQLETGPRGVYEPVKFSAEGGEPDDGFAGFPASEHFAADPGTVSCVTDPDNWMSRTSSVISYHEQ